MLVHVALGYAAVNWAFAKGSRALVHVTALVTLLAAMAAGLVARARLLRVLGMASSALFSLTIAAQWVANFFLAPCDGS